MPRWDTDASGRPRYDFETEERAIQYARGYTDPNIRARRFWRIKKDDQKIEDWDWQNKIEDCQDRQRTAERKLLVLPGLEHRLRQVERDVAELARMGREEAPQILALARSAGQIAGVALQVRELQEEVSALRGHRTRMEIQISDLEERINSKRGL